MPHLSLKDHDHALGQLEAGQHVEDVAADFGCHVPRFIVYWSNIVLQETLVTFGVADNRGWHQYIKIDSSIWHICETDFSRHLLTQDKQEVSTTNG